MLAEFADNHPEIMAIIIAIAGFLVAGVLARLVEYWLMRMEGYLRRTTPARLENLDLEGLRRALRALVYYGTLIIFLLMALQTLSISIVQEWLGTLLQYVPQLILGGLIILSGYLLGVVVRNLLASMLGISAEQLVPRVAQLLVVTAAVLTGLAQTAIDISFISNVIVILLAFFFGGLSLAFALGSRKLVENLLARRALDRYRIGDLIRLDSIQGRIIEILGTAVVLESEEGVITVPTSRFVDTEVMLINEDEVDGDGGNDGTS
jgi:hypothetical protein